MEPYAVVHAEGQWYALGRAPEHDAVRAFRLDRILDVQATDDRFEPPETFDLEAYLSGERVFFTDVESEVEVRYSAAVAPWILERGWGEVHADGSVVVRHVVADPGWVVRHVLQFEGEAEVVGPPEVRHALRSAAMKE